MGPTVVVIPGFMHKTVFISPGFMLKTVFILPFLLKSGLKPGLGSHRRSPPVSYLRMRNGVIPVPGSCAEMLRKEGFHLLSRMSGMFKTIGELPGF